MTEAVNVWTQYGLQGSPFFLRPLDPHEESAYPIGLFVGRGQESQAVLTRIASNDNSVTMVEGGTGVGKTTFVNHLKHVLMEEGPRFLVPEDHIRLSVDYGLRDLVADLLSQIVVSAYRTPEVRDELEELDSFQTAAELVRGSREEGWHAEVKVMGTGGGAGKEPVMSSPLLEPQQYVGLIRDTVRELASVGVDGVMIHVNNLENLALKEPERIRPLFNDARDYLQIPGLHFVFCGPLGFQNEHLSKDERVRSIFPVPTQLENLEVDQVGRLIQKRYDHLRMDDDFTAPVDGVVLATLYEVFRGNLRAMFKIVNEGLERRGFVPEPTPVDLVEIQDLVRNRCHAYLDQNLNESARELLSTLRDVDSPFRQTDVLDEVEVSQGRVSTLFSQLEEGEAIVLVRTRGRSKYYDLSGIAKMAFGLVEDAGDGN